MIRITGRHASTDVSGCTGPPDLVGSQFSLTASTKSVSCLTWLLSSFSIELSANTCTPSWSAYGAPPNPPVMVA